MVLQASIGINQKAATKKQATTNRNLLLLVVAAVGGTIYVRHQGERNGQV